MCKFNISMFILEMTPCPKIEEEQFPDRMSNWTFVVMKEMV